MHISCPNCNSLCNPDEIDYQRCNTCGFPNHKKSDEAIQKENQEEKEETKLFKRGCKKTLINTLILFVALVLGLSVNQMIIGLNPFIASVIIIGIYSVIQNLIGKKNRP